MSILKSRDKRSAHLERSFFEDYFILLDFDILLGEGLWDRVLMLSADREMIGLGLYPYD